VQPVRLDNPAVRAIPRTHIHNVGVQAGITLRPVPPGARVRELPTGHDCMITMPAELTALLVEAAQASDAASSTKVRAANPVAPGTTSS
jgi:hypothetical protein